MGFARGPKLNLQNISAFYDVANPKSYTSGSSSWKGLSKQETTGSLSNVTFDTTNGIKSLGFNGSTSNVVFNLNNDISGNNPWTIILWDKISSNETGDRSGWLIWQGSNSQTVDQLIGIAASNGNIEVAHWSNDTEFTNAKIKYDEWAMYSVTFDGANEFVYVNDEQLGSKTTTLSITTGTWYLNSRANSEGFLEGNTAIVQIYNRALSEQEIQNTFNAYKGRFGID